MDTVTVHRPEKLLTKMLTKTETPVQILEYRQQIFQLTMKEIIIAFVYSPTLPQICHAPCQHE